MHVTPFGGCSPKIWGEPCTSLSVSFHVSKCFIFPVIILWICDADLQLVNRFVCIPVMLICNPANRLIIYIWCCFTTLIAIIEENSRRVITIEFWFAHCIFQTLSASSQTTNTWMVVYTVKLIYELELRVSSINL